MNALYNNWVILRSIPNVGYQMEQWDTRLYIKVIYGVSIQSGRNYTVFMVDHIICPPFH